MVAISVNQCRDDKTTIGHPFFFNKVNTRLRLVFPFIRGWVWSVSHDLGSQDYQIQTHRYSLRMEEEAIKESIVHGREQ